ncbi:MAG: DNA alkylation repair protein [Tenericutes bacterium]|nr:DNA alkylation repair protein [Mycoplasmatota bacterium]
MSHTLNDIKDYMEKHMQSNQKKVLSTKSGSLDVIGVSMKDIRALAKRIKTNHQLANTLFETSTYDYLMLGSIIADYEQLDTETTKEWLTKAQSTAIVDQGLAPLLMQHEKRHQMIKTFIEDSNIHIRYAGYSLLSSYFRSEDLKTLDIDLGIKALVKIKKTLNDEPLTIQNAMNNAVVMAGLHVPDLVSLAKEVADYIGHVMPLVARNQCNIQSASDYIVRYSSQPKYSRVARLKN